MAGKPFQPDDPLELVGVAVPADAAALEEMARTFVEEFLRQGWEERRLLGLFRNPFFRAPHFIYRTRGEAYVRALIGETAARWGLGRAAQEGEGSGDA